jgi:ABC-2 type transport system permease protein
MKRRNLNMIIKKDLRGLMNERTILLAVLLQLFIALFSSFLVIGLASMYDPTTLARFSGVRYGVAYAGTDSALEDYLRSSGQIVVFPMNLSQGVTLLGERKISAVIYVPDTPPDSTEPVKITLYLLENDIQSAIVNVKLKAVLLQYEQELRDIRESRLDVIPIPLQFPENTGGSSFYEFIYGLLIPLLVLLPAIISAALVIDLITEEYQHHTLETLLSTPMSLHEVIWGKILTCELLVPVQAGAWLILLSLNGILIEGIVPILVQVMAFSMVLILIGALTALYYRERTAAQFIFSTAVVVLMILALAIPDNPLNLVARIATGSAGLDQWVILGIVGLVALFLSMVVYWYTIRASRTALTGG